MSFCKICGLKSHGTHFGVISCRSCAAFFRRYVVLNLKYKCVNDKQSCTINGRLRITCRQCRYDKCVKMGMTTNNVQWNRDSNQNLLKREGLKYCNENTEMIENPSTSRCSSSVSPQANPLVCSLISQCQDNMTTTLTEIFNSDEPCLSNPELDNMNDLEKFAHGLKCVREEYPPGQIEFHKRLTRDILVNVMDKQVIKLAKLAMYSEGVRSLSTCQKIHLFKVLFVDIHRLERMDETLQVYGERCLREKIMLISPNTAVCLDKCRYQIEGLSSEENEKLNCYFQKNARNMLDYVGRPLFELNCSSMEMAYMLCQMFIHNEHQFNESTQVICENFLTTICDNLHEYYKKEKIGNYASRITKMMNIVITIRKLFKFDCTLNK